MSLSGLFEREPVGNRQNRVTLVGSNMTLLRRIDEKTVILISDDARSKREIWTENEDFDGYVIAIDGKGYAFDKPWTPDDEKKKIKS
jgi:hypothetical protein